MKTLKDFKDACKVGSFWDFKAHWTNGVSCIRECKVSQSRSVAFTHPSRDGLSWLEFPKRSWCIFANGGVYLVEPALQGPFREWLDKNGSVDKYPDAYLFYRLRG